jgi:16S rRNA (uracil1498-N3)-methyltransferase
MSRSKSPPRVYVPLDAPAHGVCDLSPEASHHLLHVLRLSNGDAVVIFDGNGHEYDATIDRVSRSGIRVKLRPARSIDRESRLEVTLAQGISSGDRMDYTIQKAVELGVYAIQPLTTERSVVRLDAARAAKRIAHWRSVAIAACEQCGRNRVPEIAPVSTLTGWLGSAVSPASLRLTLSPHAPARLAALERDDMAQIILLVGPEGGLAPREEDDALTAGFIAVRLGPRVLRTETAAVAALAALQTLWGDF